ncbi:putative class I glutamine amidotransferase [Xylariaceae sp. FL0804]|nr:putative class I glutamine amidotransferase [Xylariaceae sp. FL0804]
MGSSPTQAPIRLAILEADTPAPGIRERYGGGYGGVFTHLFERACADAGVPLSDELELSTYHVVDDEYDDTSTTGEAGQKRRREIAYPDPEAVDAVLITGSKHNAYDADAWIDRLVAYARRCLEGGRVRVIGVCFGHQVVGRAVGARVGLNPRGWELSVVEHELTEAGRRYFGMDKLSMNQMHRDAVLDDSLPGVEILARTEICPNQAMYSPGRFITVQGHPEFTSDMVREILEMRRYGGAIGKDLYADGMRRVADAQQGVQVARVFLKFLRE